MNVALPERTETYPEKGRSQGGRAGQTSSTSTNQRTSFWGKTCESQRLRAFRLCALSAL